MTKKAVVSDPENASLWDTLGWTNYRAGRIKEAIAQLERATQLAPEKGVLHYHLAKALLADGQRQEGEEALSKALRYGLPATEQRDAMSLMAKSG